MSLDTHIGMWQYVFKKLKLMCGGIVSDLNWKKKGGKTEEGDELGKGFISCSVFS
jgi:hypothetical protein